MSEANIRVLVADDHTVVRKGLAALLSAEKYGIEVIGEASNGGEAVQKAEQLKPDVILMDLVMPGKSGIEAIAEIRQMQPRARILVLTSFADDDNVIEAIRAGAYGFLLKDTSPDELVQTIHSVYADKLTIPQELTHVLFGSKGAQVERRKNLDDLTKRELDVLKCIAQGMSNKQIAQTLSIGTTTVRSHVSSMIHKLNLENRTQLAIYAREHDLI
ncbi:MAG: response regulator [Anaerolineales bacterium]|jgi:NarL family two-component system response regulator LiaR